MISSSFQVNGLWSDSEEIWLLNWHLLENLRSRPKIYDCNWLKNWKSYRLGRKSIVPPVSGPIHVLPISLLTAVIDFRAVKMNKLNLVKVLNMLKWNQQLDFRSCGFYRNSMIEFVEANIYFHKGVTNSNFFEKTV